MTLKNKLLIATIAWLSVTGAVLSAGAQTGAQTGDETGDERSAAVAGETGGAKVFGSEELRPCHLLNHRQEFLCGQHTVYENRAAASGREIDIHYALIPAVDEKPEPDPVVVFAGGPGQAAMEMMPLVRRVFEEVAEHRSVILIDQRGMGTSHPLDCDLPDEEELVFDQQELEKKSREAIERCLETWDADVRFYTQDLANEDIHEILLALGFSRVNLYGASWGTRSALLYAHQFPDQVRSIVLDGALPLQNSAPLYAAADADRALRALFADCAADSACHEAFPNLEDDFRQAMEQLDAPAGEKTGRQVTIDHPSTGRPLTFVMTRSVFGGLLRAILYSPELSRVVPWIIHRANQGDYRPLVGVASFLSSRTGESMTPGASLAIFCSEELARIADDDPELAKETLLGNAFFESLRDSCSLWPKTALPKIYGEDVRSEAPALILSGAVDPITPPRWGEAMSQVLPNSLHLVAPNTGHNVSPFGCAPELVDQFIEKGSVEGLDGSCLEDLKRPSFFVDASGPKADLNHD